MELWQRCAPENEQFKSVCSPSTVPPLLPITSSQETLNRHEIKKMPKVLFFFFSSHKPTTMMKTSCAVGYCCSQLSQRKSQAVSRTHTMKDSLVGLSNGLLMHKTVEMVQGSRGKCGNPLLGLGHSGRQSPTGQVKGLF